jgi:hypothetical protein
MHARRRLGPYLLINIFVSALVTGTIIYFYDRARQAECTPPPPNLTSATSQTGDVNVSITGVIGAGTVTDERVVIQNNGNEKLLLTGWTLGDDKGNLYTFPQSPQLTLFPGATVQVHTRTGTDSPTDFYWGRSAAVWTSGELAALYDPENIARAFYRIP